MRLCVLIDWWSDWSAQAVRAWKLKYLWKIPEHWGIIIMFFIRSGFGTFYYAIALKTCCALCIPLAANSIMLRFKYFHGRQMGAKFYIYLIFSYKHVYIAALPSNFVSSDSELSKLYIFWQLKLCSCCLYNIWMLSVSVCVWNIWYHMELRTHLSAFKG